MMPEELPPLNLSTSASSSAKGGEFFGGASPWNEQEWTVNTGSGDNGLSPKTVLLLALVGLGALWLKHKKS